MPVRFCHPTDLAMGGEYGNFFSLALGPHSQRELTLTPSLGSPCPRGRRRSIFSSPGMGPAASEKSYRNGMMTLTTLIDPATLASRLDDPDLVLIDCRFALDNVTW